MTIEEANRLLIASLSELYDEREAAAISSLVMERLTGMPKSLRIVQKTNLFTEKQEELFQYYLDELVKNRPVQYVLSEAWFGPYLFYVDENVLIPRPETEELADWLLKETESINDGLDVLDIGTGSGCIPVYLMKKRKRFRMFALDISDQALGVARKNSETHDVAIQFFKADIRDRQQYPAIPQVDVIISNPPYIPEFQRVNLDIHVRNFEPGLALFVPDSDPIVYYKIIGELALLKLKKGGMMFLEIHHDYSHEVVEWYLQNGFSIVLKKDFSGNDRMLKVKRN